MKLAVDGVQETSRVPALTLKLPTGLLGETSVFFLASGLDFLLTRFMLLGFGKASRIGQVVEANPVARFILNHWGFDGLMMFKLGMVVLVAVICQIIATRRVDVARRLMLFATIAVLVVVVYSMQLLVQHA